MEKPKGPGDCAACAKVLRHAVRYADGTDCGLHPGIEGVIRNAIEAQRDQSAYERRRVSDLEAAIKRLLDGNEAAKEANITHLRDVLDGHAT